MAQIRMGLSSIADLDVIARLVLLLHLEQLELESVVRKMSRPDLSC